MDLFEEAEMETTGFAQFIELLGVRLQEGLPGQVAHRRMIPLNRMAEFNLGNGTGRPSAVLLLLYPAQEFISCVLIKRQVYNGYHSGQIALPGGKFQPSDQDLLHTALREAEEEVGVNPGQIKILGPMTDLFIPPSNFLLTPFLAFKDQKPAFKANVREVAEILELDIRHFSPRNRKEKDITLHNGSVVRTPYYDIKDHVIWGATAMIISEFEMLAEGLY